VLEEEKTTEPENPVKTENPQETEKPTETEKSAFVDVAKGQYYYDAVKWAAEEGITGGTSATTFSPNAVCTRGQVVTFLHRMVASPEPAAITNPFTDVKTNAYYYKPVMWAYGSKITGGTSANKFSPDNNCTRAQVVTFLWRCTGQPKAENAKNPFTDVKTDAYYYDAVLWAVEQGITGGTSTTTFSPDNNCTRAQVVTFLYRFINK
ncbi:MAG: S-layer homology domain-containing protein, partial [Ruminococcaceae bacterium]|nr:S-layer homology domain-containing protein [Oscillospiraceae bacterium]